MEQWKPVVGFEGLYEVSNEGNVRSIPHVVPHHWKGHTRVCPGKILIPGITSNKRRSVRLSKDGKAATAYISQLVMAAFVGPRPKGMHVLHWDDDCQNDSLENLRYGTPQENMQDKRRNGNMPIGTKHHAAKLTEEKVREIKARLSAGEYYRSIAIEFGVSKEAIQSIKHGRSWGWLN